MATARLPRDGIVVRVVKSRETSGLLLALCLCGMAANVSGRSIDPLITVVSAEFHIGVTIAALLTSAYSLPFALCQPVLGPMGDIYGKVRVLRASLWILSACLLIAAIAPNFWTLMGARFCAGLAAGGIIPACMATIGDTYPPEKRQVAISRFVTVGLLAQIFAASASGVLVEPIGWRGVLLGTAVIAVGAAITATIKLPAGARAAGSFGPRAVAQNYRSVFQNPKAIVCYATVFLEGIALYGLFPFISDVLQRGGTGGSAEAGFIIGAVGVGGVAYTSVISLLLRKITRYQFMSIGGLLLTAGPLTLATSVPWHICAAAFFVTGFGFMLLHNSIQTEVVDLAPASRQSAYSLHAFSFFTGQALGPVIFGALLSMVDQRLALVISALILLLAGLTAARPFKRLSVLGK